MQLWTYEAVLKAVEKGGRVCEAEDKAGIFRIKYLEGFKALGQRKDAMEGIWNVREQCEEEVEVEEDMVTLGEDARKEASNKQKKLVRASSNDVDMDDLVDILLEAKIGVAQDSVVDDIAEGVLRL